MRTPTERRRDTRFLLAGVAVGVVPATLLGVWASAGLGDVAATAAFAIFGGLVGCILGFFSALGVLLWRRRRPEPSRVGGPRATEGLIVRYCSSACEELSAKTLVVALLAGNSGPCTFCMKPTTYGRGHTTTMFPYRNQKAFVCEDCLPQGRAFMAGVSECCLCQKAL